MSFLCFLKSLFVCNHMQSVIMLDILDFNVYILLNYWPQLIGVFILVAFYKFGFIYREHTEEKKHEDAVSHEDYIACDSANCVRCRAYTQRSMPVLCEEWTQMIRKMDPVKAKSVERITFTMQEYPKQRLTKRDPTFRLLSLVTDPYYHEKDFNDDTDILKQNWKNIYSEYLAVAQSESGWNINSTPSGKWGVFYLVNQGSEVGDNLLRCPKTHETLKKLQNVMTGVMFGNACFSVVYPRTLIKEHYGPCNLRVRCHLGLDVPDECELWVDGRKSRWKRGKCLLFDDSYLHSVLHSGSEEDSRPRAILLVDFWNPGLNAGERELLSRLLCSSKVKTS